MRIRIYLLALLSIVLLAPVSYCGVWDGGRLVGRWNDEDRVITIGSSLEFPEFSPDYALWSLCGEIGAAIHKNPIASNTSTEFMGILGVELFFPLLRVRVLSNVVDLFKTNQRIGWAIEGGIVIPVTDWFWFTINIGRGTAFSANRTLQTHFPAEVIIRNHWHLW